MTNQTDGVNSSFREPPAGEIMGHPTALWQLFNIEPNFIGDMIACLYMGKYHVGYQIPSAFGLLVTHGSLFALAVSGFLWKDNWKIASFHCMGAVLTLLMPQWLFGVSTGEGAAMYCFYSIPLTVMFTPYFAKFFIVHPTEISGDLAYKNK